VDLDFEVSLVYKASSRTAWITQRNPVSKTKQNKQKSNKNKTKQNNNQPTNQPLLFV
jgi:predicted KAP-like P-loop ATPase